MKTTYVNFLCEYDGHPPFALCTSIVCPHQGYFCIFCYPKHDFHFQSCYDFSQIRYKIEWIRKTLLQIAYQFNKWGNRSYATQIEKFTNVTWRLEHIPTKIIKKEFDQELLLFKKTQFLKQVLQSVKVKKDLNKHLFKNLKQYFFFYNSQVYDLAPNEYRNILMQITISYLLFVFLLRFFYQ